MEKSQQGEAEPLMSKAEKGDIRHVVKVDITTSTRNDELHQVVVDGHTTGAENNVQDLGEKNNVTEEINDIEMESLSETFDVETEKVDPQEKKRNQEVNRAREDDRATSDEGFHNVMIFDDDNVCENCSPAESCETFTNDDEDEENVVAERDDKNVETIPNDLNMVKVNKNNDTSTEDKDKPYPKNSETLDTPDEEQKQTRASVSELCQTESDNTFLPGQISDNEESMVSKKSIKRQLSRKSVTFSDDEKTEKEDSKTNYQERQPIKPRKSRMQILDEIASAATEVVDDFDSIGKNR